MFEEGQRHSPDLEEVTLAQATDQVLADRPLRRAHLGAHTLAPLFHNHLTLAQLPYYHAK